MSYLRLHDEHDDDTVVLLDNGIGVDLYGLFGDPDVEAGRDVTLIGQGFTWVRIRKDPGQDVGPNDRTLNVIVVAAMLGFSGIPLVLSPRSQGQVVRYNRWLSASCSISEGPDPKDVAIPPLELRAYIRHASGDLV